MSSDTMCNCGHHIGNHNWKQECTREGCTCKRFRNPSLEEAAHAAWQAAKVRDGLGHSVHSHKPYHNQGGAYQVGFMDGYIAAGGTE